jgi:MFS family permease
MAILGIALGSVIGGQMISNGRIKVVLVFNVVAIAASVSSMFVNLWLIAISRLVHGFASGVLVTAAPKTLEESIPAHLLGYGFGCSTNILINAAIMCLMFLGIAMPGTDEELATSSLWRLFYAFPIPFSALAVLMHLVRHKGESPHFYVSIGEKSKALEGLQQVYPEEPSETLVKLYEQQRAIFEE